MTKAQFKLIITKEAIGILGFIPLGKKGITLFPLASSWGIWLPSAGMFKVFNIRSKYMALLDYADHHPASPWHLLESLEDSE
jgi:hypothetical protein